MKVHFGISWSVTRKNPPQESSIFLMQPMVIQTQPGQLHDNRYFSSTRWLCEKDDLRAQHARTYRKTEGSTK